MTKRTIIEYSKHCSKANFHHIQKEDEDNKYFIASTGRTSLYKNLKVSETSDNVEGGENFEKNLSPYYNHTITNSHAHSIHNSIIIKSNPADHYLNKA